MPEQLRILEGATFCICDDVGDLQRDGEGLFTEDTRFLSRFRLTINGQRPLLLSSDKIEYFSAAFFMRNPLAGGLEQDVLSIRRERFVGDGMQDLFAVQNQGMEPIEFDLELEVGTDFADIFAVKDYDFALGDPLRAKPLPSLRPIEYDGESNQFLISDNGELPLKTQVIFSQRGEVNGSGVKFHLALEPRQRWNLDVEIIPLPDGEPVATRFAQRRFAFATLLPPGSCASLSSGRPGMHSGTPSDSRSPISRRCACSRTATESESSRAPGCPGS
jgi:glycogen debranching enzyme